MLHLAQRLPLSRRWPGRAPAHSSPNPATAEPLTRISMDGGANERVVLFVQRSPVELAGVEPGGLTIEVVASADQALDRVRTRQPALVVVDLAQPDALRTLWQLREYENAPPVVVLVGPANDPERVRRALELGARDCLLAPVSVQGLHQLLSPHEPEEATRATPCCEQLGDEHWFVASSAAMLKLRSQILQIAPVDVPVFICGESGVGKEILARMLHTRSSRAQKPFVKVNCAALPAELLESELFGYEPGAFTGAVRCKPGKFELAQQGTIFLDEIAEMTPHLQAKLLHVLQDGQFSRLGGRSSIQLDVRVVAATNVSIEQALASGHLRHDLYYRLSVFTLHVPPLRARQEEIPLLFAHFVERYSQKYGRQVPPPPRYLLEAAMRYPWPGNLRELENFVKRYVILGDPVESFQELLRLSLGRPSEVQPAPVPGNGHELKLRWRRQATELEAILQALERTRGCRKHAAALLGISYKALLQKMRRLGLDPGPASHSTAAEPALRR